MSRIVLELGTSRDVTETRWQRAEREQAERRGRDRLAADTRLSHWTGRWPLTFLLVFLGLGLVALLVGLGVYSHDAPLRRPDLPQVAGQVVDRHQGRSAWATVRYTAEGRQFETRFGWSGRPPGLGTTTSVRYLPGQPGRARPAGGAWDPAYQKLFVLAGCVAVIAPAAYVAAVAGARRRLRKRREAAARPQTDSPAQA